jgi:hypothetical protein
MASRDLAEIGQVMMNMYWELFDFQVLSVPGRHWSCVIETFRPSPQDILEPGREQPIMGDSYSVEGRSIVVLMPQEPSTPHGRWRSESVWLTRPASELRLRLSGRASVDQIGINSRKF